MSDKDRGNLLAIVDSCSKILKFTKDLIDADDFFENDKTFDAVLMNFVIIGEAVSRLSQELKDMESDIPWNGIKGFRNIVTHDYFGVDAEEVWQIVKNKLPELIVNVNAVLKRMDGI